MAQLCNDSQKRIVLDKTSGLFAKKSNFRPLYVQNIDTGLLKGSGRSYKEFGISKNRNLSHSIKLGLNNNKLGQDARSIIKFSTKESEVIPSRKRGLKLKKINIFKNQERKRIDNASSPQAHDIDYKVMISKYN